MFGNMSQPWLDDLSEEWTPQQPTRQQSPEIAVFLWLLLASMFVVSAGSMACI
jgi:hypothetical protein